MKTKDRRVSLNSGLKINLLISLVTIGLFIFLGYLLVSNYRTQIELKDSAGLFFYNRAQSRAADVASYFNGLTETLEGIAKYSEISDYYANKALGMSLEYGLKASLVNVRKRFELILHESKNHGVPNFEALIFRDENSAYLIGGFREEQVASDYVLKKVMSLDYSVNPYFHVFEKCDDLCMAVSIPFIFKGEHKGMITGVISDASLVKALALDNQEDVKGERLSLIYDRKFVIPVDSGQADHYKDLLARVPLSLKNGEYFVLNVIDGVFHHDVAVYIVPINRTPFELMVCVPESLISGGQNPVFTLYLMVAITFFLIVVFFYAWKLTLNNKELQTRLEDEARKTSEIEREVDIRTKELKQANQDLEREVCERKKAETELKSAQTQLLQSEKMASIGQLAAGVAHEINNPMGYIYSNLFAINDYSNSLIEFIQKVSEILDFMKNGDKEKIEASLSEVDRFKQDAELDFIIEDLCNAISESKEGAERVKKIVQDLKTFSHSQESDQELADLNDGIRTTLNIVASELKYKAEVIQELGELPRVKCYPQQINQVIMNLLVNAAHAIEEKGTVRIKSYSDKDSVHISIEDTGSGIDPKVMPKIFDPFFTTKEIGKGTGLGLSMSYNIIAAHGGHIDVKSNPGEGTTFTISLPLKEESLGEDANESA